MKICLVIIIIVLFGIIGILYKRKLEDEYYFLKYIQDFNNYFSSNVVLFKNNIVEIIDNYIIMQKNKNANFCNLFLKNGNIYEFNEKILKSYISSNDTKELIKLYFKNLGKNEYSFEKEKLNEFNVILKQKIDESYNNLKNKGDLYFKLLLAIGAIIGILLWWFMDVSILFKIGAIGILATVISQLFQHQGRSDLATLTGLAGLIVVLVIVLGMVGNLFGILKNLFDMY